MKDLLTLQKKIRVILEDWLVYCRSCLGILQPEKYLIHDFTLRNKLNRYNENHSDYNKIVFYRRKSKSAAEINRNHRLLNSLVLAANNNNNKNSADDLKSGLKHFGNTKLSKSTHQTDFISMNSKTYYLGKFTLTLSLYLKAAALSSQ